MSAFKDFGVSCGIALAALFLVKPLLIAMSVTVILRSPVFAPRAIARFPGLCDFSHLHVLRDDGFDLKKWAALQTVMRHSPPPTASSTAEAAAEAGEVAAAAAEAGEVEAVPQVQEATEVRDASSERAADPAPVDAVHAGLGEMGPEAAPHAEALAGQLADEAEDRENASAVVTESARAHSHCSSLQVHKTIHLLGCTNLAVQNTLQSAKILSNIPYVKD